MRDCERQARGRNCFRLSLLVPVLLIAASGCVSAPKDITRSEEVQSSNIIGQCLMLERDVKLYRYGRPFPRLVIDPRMSNREAGGPPEYVAELSAGTRLRIARVVNADVYFDGLFSINNDVTFARIETGHQAGRLVDLGWQTFPRSKWMLQEQQHGPYVRCPGEP